MNDYPGEQTQYNEIDLRCQKFSGAVTGPSGDVLIFEKIFDIVCQDIVKTLVHKLDFLYFKELLTL